MWQIKVYSGLAAVLIIIPTLIYLVFNRAPEKQPKETQEQKLEKEFFYIENNINFISKLRKGLNKKEISIRNCSGILEDENNDGFYDKSELFPNDIHTDRENKIKIIYNVCGYETVKGNPIDFVFFTDNMINNFYYEIKEGPDKIKFIPALKVKSLNKKQITKKVALPIDFFTSKY